MKVLILEQEKTIRDSLVHLMGGCGCFEVFSAHSRQEGGCLFNSIPFDVILCGHKLCDGDGLELLKEFICQKPGLVSILMTAHSDDLLRQKAAEAGVRGYLEKPFDLKQLEEAIGMTLSCDVRPSVPLGRDGFFPRRTGKDR